MAFVFLWICEEFLAYLHMSGRSQLMKDQVRLHEDPEEDNDAELRNTVRVEYCRYITTVRYT